MKSLKIVSILISLLFATIMGGLFSSIIDAQVMVAGVNILPAIISGGLFGCSFIPMTPIGVLGFNLGALTDDNFTSFELAAGSENMGGFTQVAYLGLRSHIAGYPDLPDPNATTLEDLVKLDGDFSFASGKHFIKILCVPGGLELNPESQGEYPGAKSYKLGGSFTLAGFSPKNRGIARILNNEYGVLIIPEEDGTRLCVGTEMRPIHFTGKGKSGAKAADTKTMVFEFTTDSFVPGYTYEGEIPLHGETLPPVS